MRIAAAMVTGSYTDAADRIRRLVDDLRDAAPIGAGRGERVGTIHQQCDCGGERRADLGAEPAGPR